MRPTPPRPDVTRVLVLSLLLPLTLLPARAVAVPRAAAADTGWSLAPAGGGRPSFYAEGAPGTVVRDRVSVTNGGGHPVTVSLAADGVLAAFADPRVLVPARSRAEVPFTVRVSGDRTGTITARDAVGRTRSVPLRLRAGVPALSALTVERVAVRADRITYDIVNRGTTTLSPRLAVRADGVLGPVLDRAPRTLPVRLAPGTRTSLAEPWPDRPALDAVDVRLTVTAPDGTRATAGASARFVPWAAVAGCGGAALATAAGVTWAAVRRRRGHPSRKCSAPDTPTAVPDNRIRPLSEAGTTTGAPT
ncbi:hypothetical protein [Streptomyces sp. MAA16]|uniref:hypothetical protein n=1 Tax=Streptomyces sp. MAA16 TaxID=3035116 RepID=UPI0024757783|nr:hypothetical protein [Streptomyces sp. MAA16]MDH6701930.1 hypothetical protein [Streptomyces sp. MAA16]